MTVGWIFEGDRDRFLAATEPPIPSIAHVPTYQCPLCKEIFRRSRLLSAHLESTHVVKRPFLLMAGMEPNSEDVIRTTSVIRSVEIFNCTELSVSVDGEALGRIQTSDLIQILGKLKRATIQLRLLNTGDRYTAPVTSDYHLRVVIPDEISLASVDEQFVRELGSEGVNLERVGSFYQTTRAGASAEYAEALADYVRAVLIKDGDPRTGVSTRLHHNLDIYSRALSTLQSFERPLAKLLSALIRFGLNDFTRWQDATGFEILDHAYSLLGPLAEFDRMPLGVGKHQIGRASARVFVCPIDVGTDSVTRLAKQAAELTRWGTAAEQQFSALAEQESISPLDRAKIRALWAATALRLGASASAQKVLSLLDGDPTFGLWTASKLAKVES
jgi:hypothetical protein